MGDSGRLSGSRPTDRACSTSRPDGFDPGRCVEVVNRIRNIDYWEGSGNDLIDWVTLGYVEDGRGRRQPNPHWEPLP